MTGERLCVEEYALEWYSNNGGWNGIHSEVDFRVELASRTLSYSSHPNCVIFFSKDFENYLKILSHLFSFSSRGLCGENYSVF